MTHKKSWAQLVNATDPDKRKLALLLIKLETLECIAHHIAGHEGRAHQLRKQLVADNVIMFPRLHGQTRAQQAAAWTAPTQGPSE